MKKAVLAIPMSMYASRFVRIHEKTLKELIPSCSWTARNLQIVYNYEANM